MIDPQTIARIKDTADIVDVVSEFVSLKKAGVNYRGLCPFHDDHTPSFYVSPSRGTCHCFVCGEGGDSVGFIMKHEQLTYPEALRWLASRYHIEIEEKDLTNEQKREQSEREAMFIINEQTAKYYSDILENDIDGRAIGMQYFRQRAIRDDIIAKFRLGFALSNREAMPQAMTHKGYQADLLIKTGLCYQDDNKRLIDRFAGRVIFPWLGISGKVVAFGGRVLDSRTKGVSQKYINSPDSAIYHKDHELYGLYQAKKAITRENLVYMVEGYTDVLSMHQCGIENVVANSGTALSEHQIRLLHRFTSNIVLLYDGDEAGIKAALRGTDMLLKDGMNVKVMLLPDGDDPDSFARKYSADKFRQYIKEHQTDFIEFMIKVKLNGVTDPHQRSEGIATIIKALSVISDPITRAEYVQMCAMRLGLSEQLLTSSLNEEIRNYRDKQRDAERHKQQPQQNFNSTGQQPVTSTATPVGIPNPDSEYIPVPPPGYDYQSAQPQQPHYPTTSPVRKEPKIQETVPYLIIKTVITQGGKLLYDNVQTDDGQTISLTIAQYIAYDLSLDNLSLGKPLYDNILAEAASHTADENFDTMRHFSLHADEAISSLATHIISSTAMVSESLRREMSIEQLRENVSHLLLDFRNAYILTQLQQVKSEIAQATANGDSSQLPELLKKMGELQDIRRVIAARTGR